MLGLSSVFLALAFLILVYFDLPRQIFLFFLDTPDKYWIVVSGYHLHKMFWGFLSLLISLVLWRFGATKVILTVARVAFFIGVGLVAVDLWSHWYTQGTPYFALWDLYIHPSLTK
ncbi:MAG: hypothetical protein HYW89_01940 [Candidatus Sungiibacteriota bacterium]|uniref:Uncharacterized protein n=1 Tax=Candidatus Sungiibacteriota bacterium TaxID=2750080 RepID=A0A7T5RK98_9BACT|nr:MAG: hypothetical protein HYW89_01940 [Candidatus Sungbacteria bacterium]